MTDPINRTDERFVTTPDPNSIEIGHTPGSAEGKDSPDSKPDEIGHTPGSAEGDRATVEADLDRGAATAETAF